MWVPSTNSKVGYAEMITYAHLMNWELVGIRVFSPPSLPGRQKCLSTCKETELLSRNLNCGMGSISMNLDDQLENKRNSGRSNSPSLIPTIMM